MSGLTAPDINQLDPLSPSLKPIRDILSSAVGRRYLTPQGGQTAFAGAPDIYQQLYGPESGMGRNITDMVQPPSLYGPGSSLGTGAGGGGPPMADPRGVPGTPQQPQLPRPGVAPSGGMPFEQMPVYPSMPRPNMPGITAGPPVSGLLSSGQTMNTAGLGPGGNTAGPRRVTSEADFMRPDGSYPRLSAKVEPDQFGRIMHQYYDLDTGEFLGVKETIGPGFEEYWGGKAGVPLTGTPTPTQGRILNERGDTSGGIMQGYDEYIQKLIGQGSQYAPQQNFDISKLLTPSTTMAGISPSTTRNSIPSDVSPQGIDRRKSGITY